MEKGVVEIIRLTTARHTHRPPYNPSSWSNLVVLLPQFNLGGGEQRVHDEEPIVHSLVTRNYDCNPGSGGPSLATHPHYPGEDEPRKVSYGVGYRTFWVQEYPNSPDFPDLAVLPGRPEHPQG